MTKWVSPVIVALFLLPSFVLAAEERGTKIYYDDLRSRPYEPEKIGAKRGRFYVALPEQGKIAVVDPQSRSVVKLIPVPAGPERLSAVPGMRYLYVTHQGGRAGDQKDSGGKVGASGPILGRRPVWVDFEFGRPLRYPDRWKEAR